MYRGDIRLGDTIDIKFCTVTTTGAPTTLAGTPSVAAYVGNGTTEITAGITLTVDFDSRTGLNNVRVVATGGNGFAAATNVQLVITAGTVGGTSVVGYVVAEFSIEARSALMPTTAARTLVVDAAGLADANTVKVGPTGSGTAQTAGDIMADTNDIQTRLPAALVGGRMDSSVGAMTANVLTASAINADAITAAKVADGTIDAATFAAGAINAAAIAADAITAAKIADNALDAATFVAGSLNGKGDWNIGKTGYALSAAGVQAIWDALTAALTTANSIGKLIVDNLNTTISSRMATFALPANFSALSITAGGLVDITQTAADKVWSTAARILTAGTNIVLAKGVGVTGFNDVSTAQVNAEVVDALNVDTYAEPGQAAPPATTTLVQKIGYVYKSFRNRKTQDATTMKLFGDDALTVDQKATISDNGVTYDHGEIQSGP